MERRRPCDTPPTVISPGHARPEHISHLRYQEPAYLDRTKRGRAPPIQFFSAKDQAVTVDALINVNRDGRALTVLSNHTGCSVAVEEGSLLRFAEVVEPIQHNPMSDSRPELTPTPETTLTTKPANVSQLYSKPVPWKAEYSWINRHAEPRATRRTD